MDPVLTGGLSGQETMRGRTTLIALGALAALAVATVLVPAAGQGAAPPTQSASAGGSASPTARDAAGDGMGGVRLEALASFKAPTYVHGPKGASGLVFVVEQEGKIKVIRDGEKRPGSFLNIRSKVSCCGERGLFSVAFAPDYAKSGRFYVYFTDNTGDLRIQEYRRRGDKQARARRGSARNVLRIRHRQSSRHNGGQLQFGPDGLLYIATGDGGGDLSANAQSKLSLLGKLLRIDPRRAKGRAYGIPKGNPFVGKKGKNEIFARGLRNPYRFSFDRDRRRIVIGDVGESRREEVNFEKLGRARRANFGWNAFEGTRRVPGGAAPPQRHDEPIHEYGHDGGNCSIIGGYIVRDERLSSLLGRYVYADLCVGQIRSLVAKTGGARDDRATDLAVSLPVTFGEDTQGRVYVASLGSGTVWRFEPS